MRAPVPLDDERLQDGLHPGEAKSGVAWRWTKGELALSPDFWAGPLRPVALHVLQHRDARWIAPAEGAARGSVAEERADATHVA